MRELRLKLVRALGFAGTVVLQMFIISIAFSGEVGASSNTINFQGKLVKPDGTNVPDGSYSVRFRIYSDPIADAASICDPLTTSCQWEETQTINFAAGVFHTQLGSITPLNGAVDFTNPTLFLSIKIDTDVEMSPRIEFASVAYSLNSEKLNGLTSSDFIQLGQGLQVDSSTSNPSLFINKDNASGTPNIIQVQRAGVDVFLIDNSGNTAFNGGIAQTTGNVALNGNIALGSTSSTFSAESNSSLTSFFNGSTPHTIQFATGAATQTISIGSTNSSSSLSLNAGSGNALINATSGDVLITTTTSGNIYISPATVDGNNVLIGTADTVGNLLILDSKSTAGDPTGVNGGSYYNAASGKNRCFEANIWTDCSGSRVLAESTLGANANNITLNLPANTEYIHCRLDVKSRTSNSIVYMRFNGNTGAAAYSWNTIGIVAAATTDWQDASDSEIQLSGTQTGTVAFSADINITNFQDTNKVVTWNAGGLEAAGSNSNFYSGVGGLFDTTNSISSIEFLPSAGNFRTGSHAWCEGRDVQ